MTRSASPPHADVGKGDGSKLRCSPDRAPGSDDLVPGCPGPADVHAGVAGGTASPFSMAPGRRGTRSGFTSVTVAGRENA